jgi:flagellin-like hook-associated protein FlgL
MASRQNYLDAQRASFKSSSRIGASTRMDHSSDDVAAISQASKIKSDMLSKKSYMQNLHSARSYLNFQEAGYQKVFSIYQRMEELSSESLLQPKDAKNPASKEFEELKKQLMDIKNSKMNGISIFDPVATCGEIVDIPVEGSALDYTTKDPGVIQTIRGKSVDVKAYGGKLSFNVNSGGAGEIYRVFMGQTQIFSTGPTFTGDPTDVEINRTSSGSDAHEDSVTNPVLQSNIRNADSWQTSGLAGDGDTDTIKLEFGPGVETTYQINLGNSNINESFNMGSSPQEQLKSNGGKIRVANLGANSSETQLSIHVETKSIGVISDVEFVPKFFDKQLDIDTSGNQVALKAVGFETFENFSIDSSSDAKKTSDKLLGKGDMMGEIECIGANWLPKIASAINRIDSEILAAESNTLGNEIALGRIVGSDMALATTNHAKQMLKMDMAAFVMSNITRINDVLAPLTTDHHRSELMSGDALL